jgi:hypothetical protein
MRKPLGFMDANGLVALLLELGITGGQNRHQVGSPGQKKALGMRASMLAALSKQSAESDMESARILVGQLLDMTKAQRLAENLGTDAMNDPSNNASNRWLWPEHAFKTQPPDFLTFDEFKRLLVRLAYDKYAHVRGVTNRLNQLLFNSFSRHMCLDVDTMDVQDKFEEKGVLETLNLHKSTIKKIFASACKWDMGTMDMSKFMIFCQCCKVVDHVRQTRFLLFCSRMKTSVTTVEQVFYLCIGLICVDNMKRTKPKTTALAKGDKPPKSSRNDFDKEFSNWLTSRLLYNAWDWKKMEDAMKSKRKTSEVSLAIAWKKRKNPMVVAKEAAEKAEREAKFIRLNQQMAPQLDF